MRLLDLFRTIWIWNVVLLSFVSRWSCPPLKFSHYNLWSFDLRLLVDVFSSRVCLWNKIVARNSRAADTSSAGEKWLLRKIEMIDWHQRVENKEFGMKIYIKLRWNKNGCSRCVAVVVVVVVVAVAAVSNNCLYTKQTQRSHVHKQTHTHTHIVAGSTDHT